MPHRQHFLSLFCFSAGGKKVGGGMFLIYTPDLRSERHLSEAIDPGEGVGHTESHVETDRI